MTHGMVPDGAADIDGERAPRRHYAYFDLGFYQPCNMRCHYCRPEIITAQPDFGLQALREQTTAFKRRFRAAAAKLSGYGEISLWDHYEEGINYLSDEFPMVQVISNGTWSPRALDIVLSHANVSPNFTIDGHTPEANRLRTRGSQALHDTMWRNVHRLVDAGRPLEINCVLHGENADQFEAYCRYLTEFGAGAVVLFPFPVKPFALAPDTALEVRKGLERLAPRIDELWAEYAALLPPPAYGQRLKQFIESGSRSGVCHVHWANLGSGSRNERLHCPNYGESLTYGPMSHALDEAAEAIEAEEYRHLQNGYVGPECRGCFNHFHILNLYLEELIGLDELAAIPSLNHVEALATLSAMKREFTRDYTRHGSPAETRGT